MTFISKQVLHSLVWPWTQVCSPGWPWTLDPFASTSQVLGLSSCGAYVCGARDQVQSSLCDQQAFSQQSYIQLQRAFNNTPELWFLIPVLRMRKRSGMRCHSERSVRARWTPSSLTFPIFYVEPWAWSSGLLCPCGCWWQKGKWQTGWCYLV